MYISHFFLALLLLGHFKPEFAKFSFYYNVSKYFWVLYSHNSQSAKFVQLCTPSCSLSQVSQFKISLKPYTVTNTTDIIFFT